MGYRDRRPPPQDEERLRFENDDDPWIAFVRLNVRVETLERWKERYDNRDEDSRRFTVQNSATSKTTWLQTALIATVTVLAVVIAHFLH